MTEKKMVSADSTYNPPQGSDPLAAAVLNSISAHIAILDENGVILETNRAWKAFTSANSPGDTTDSVGMNYLKICETATGDDEMDGRKVAQGIRSVIAGEVEEFLHDYPCHSPTGRHWYYMRAIRMAGDRPVRVIISHEEITALKLAEEALKKREQELESRKQTLEETNIALKVLLRQRENDKEELETKFLVNIREMVLPYVERLKNAQLRKRERTTVEIIDAHLNDIISPFLQRLSAANIILTPQEIQVATLVKDGKSSKEIADILNISETTVHFHRKNLRDKFGLKRKQTNLRSYLLTLS